VIRMLLILLLLLLAVPIKSFVNAPQLLSALSMTQLKRKQGARSNMARTPEISEWEMNRDGSITGIVKFHPVIDDGDDITTSPLEDITLVGPNKLVKTKSGNAYKLVNQKDTTAKKNGVAGGGFFSIFNVPDTILQQQQQQKNKVLTLGQGKYVVVGTSKTSTSGKSRIWKAYRVNPKTGQPMGDLLTIKMSSDYDSLQRESANYENLSKNIFKGAFVKKVDFLPSGEDDKSSILVIESGSANLKEWMASSRPNGLRGKEMRDAAAAAAQCLQAMHSSKLVWTDLKSENFVVFTNTKNQNLVVKGIDLESARPFGKSPVDYSPEACPPEFAQAFLEGRALDFALTPNYDMWSLGMMLYELSTGSQYFYNKSPSAITKLLSDPSFEVDVSAIQDFQLRDLVQNCLEKDPKKRPTILQLFFHPYSTTSGIGPFSF